MRGGGRVDFPLLYLLLALRVRVQAGLGALAPLDELSAASVRLPEVRRASCDAPQNRELQQLFRRNLALDACVDSELQWVQLAAVSDVL